MKKVPSPVPLQQNFDGWGGCRKGVQEETHKVVEEKKGVLRVYNVDIPIIEVTYSDGTYSTGAALGDIYISKEEIWLNFWGTKIVLEP